MTKYMLVLRFTNKFYNENSQGWTKKNRENQLNLKSENNYFYHYLLREAIKSQNRLNWGNHPNRGGGGLEDESGFQTSYFCYYNPQEKITI